VSRAEFNHELFKREVRFLLLCSLIVILFAEFSCLLLLIFLDFGLELRLGFSHRLVKLFFALVGLVNSRLASVLELFNVVSPGHDILTTELNGHLSPLPKFEHGL